MTVWSCGKRPDLLATMVGNWARESWERDSESELLYENVVINKRATSGCLRPEPKRQAGEDVPSVPKS